MDPSKKYVIVELNDGFKVEGVLADVDKTNFTIHITEATKYRTDEKGSNLAEKLSSPELNISKADIKEVKLVQYDQLTNQNKQDQRTFQQSKTLQSQVPFNSLPTTLPKRNDEKAKYEKLDFFDGLGTLSNRDTVRETIKDNEKNKETFNLPDREYNSNYQGNRGGNYGGYGRGRGQRRGGNNNNYRGNNNNNYGNRNNNNQYSRGGYQSGGGNFQSGGRFQNRGNFQSGDDTRGGGEFVNNFGGGFNNNDTDFNQNFNQRRGYRDDNRGGYNNRGRGNNRGGRGRGNYNNNNNNFNNNFGAFADDKDDKCEERGKSIYDL